VVRAFLLGGLGRVLLLIILLLVGLCMLLGFWVLRVSGYTMAVVMNVDSRKLGRKDIVKVVGFVS